MLVGSFILNIGIIFFAEPLLPANLYPHPDTSLALFTLMTAFTTMPLLFYWWHGASSWITILHSVLKPEIPAPVKPPSVARAVALDPSIPTVCQLKSLLTMVSLLNMANVAWILCVLFLASATTAVSVPVPLSTRSHPSSTLEPFIQIQLKP